MNLSRNSLNLPLYNPNSVLRTTISSWKLSGKGSSELWVVRTGVLRCWVMAWFGVLGKTGWPEAILLLKPGRNLYWLFVIRKYWVLKTTLRVFCGKEMVVFKANLYCYDRRGQLLLSLVCTIFLGFTLLSSSKDWVLEKVGSDRLLLNIKRNTVWLKGM